MTRWMLLVLNLFFGQADIAKNEQMKQLEQRSDELKGVVDDRLEDTWQCMQIRYCIYIYTMLLYIIKAPG